MGSSLLRIVPEVIFGSQLACLHPLHTTSNGISIKIQKFGFHCFLRLALFSKICDGPHFILLGFLQQTVLHNILQHHNLYSVLKPVIICYNVPAIR